MSAPKSITRFHHQDAIYLPRLQSLTMVLRVFNLIIKKSETKEETEREGKNNNILPSHHPLLWLIPISPLRPRTALLAANSFIVRCHVTSKKAMRAHASMEKISSKHFKLFKGDCAVNIKYNRTIIKLWKLCCSSSKLLIKFSTVTIDYEYYLRHACARTIIGKNLV